MKVVFLKDVSRVAKAGDIKEVADGYGRNYLLPRKLAVLAKLGVADAVSAQIKADKLNEELIGLAKQLDGKEVTLKARAGAKGRLHGAITSSDIADELGKSTGLAVDKRKIALDEPIHQLGSYEITIKLAKDITPKIKVAVVAEEAEDEQRETPTT